jgi:hypothetical protein
VGARVAIGDGAARVNQAPAVWSSAKILELDFSGIEAVLLGWFMRSPSYIRLGKLGFHAYVASHVLKHPADLRWPDAELAAYFKGIKKAEDTPTQTAYNQAKRVVHGKGYGMTVHGVLRNNPKLFRNLREAEAIDRVYTDVAPEVPEFHTTVRHAAHEQHYLGGAGAYQYLPQEKKVLGHPYQYQHWFWSVVAYERLTETARLWRVKRHMPVIEIAPGQWYGVTLGEDAKRAIAFYPQSTARGVLTEACEPLFDPEHPLADQCYIGDVYYGQTPLRAPIHDSLLMEVPTRYVDYVLERAGYAMQRPMTALSCPPEWGMGEALTIGVDGKIGPDWGSMAGVSVPGWAELGVAGDVPATPAEDEDEEDLLDLEVRLSA